MALLICDHFLSIDMLQEEKHAVHLNKKHIISFITCLTAAFFVYGTTVETVA